MTRTECFGTMQRNRKLLLTFADVFHGTKKFVTVSLCNSVGIMNISLELLCRCVEVRQVRTMRDRNGDLW